MSALIGYLRAAATPTSQLRILREQKYPNPYQQYSYVPAEREVARNLVDGATIPSGQEPLEQHHKDALAAFEAMNWPDHNDFTFSRPNPHQDKIELQGVQISLFPSVLVQDKNGRRGALKLRFSKEELDERVGQLIASLLYYYGSSVLRDPSYSPDLCTVIDVRPSAIYSASANFKRLIKQIDDACIMIAAMWDRL